MLASSQPPAPATWPDDAFEKQLPKFLGALAKGKTVDEVIAWAETKGALTEAQKARIKPAAPQQDADPFTAEQPAAEQA